MLGPGPRSREWLVFALLAALPTVAMAGLALWAVRGEEAATRRELTQARRDALAEAVAAWEAQVAAVEADPTGPTPPFADRVDVAAPAAPEAASPDDRRCEAWATQIAAGDRAPRASFLAECPSTRSTSGRFLWPILALAPAAGTPADALRGWLEEHGPELAFAERAATEVDLRAAAWLDDDARAGLLTTLRASPDADLRRFLADHQGAMGARRARIAWADARSRGVIVAGDDGRYRGFVAHPRSLERALAGGWLATPRHTFGLQFAPPHDRVAAPLFKGKAQLVPAWRDPTTVARATARTRLVVLGTAVGAGLLALSLAALLWRRVRAARRLAALRTDFVAAVSHELRTPLSSLRMLSELLEGDAVPADERPELTAGLAREARRLSATVDRLLRFSRLEVTGASIERRLQPVAPLLRAAAERFGERFPDATLEVEVDGTVEAPLDAEGIAMALDNLLHNARKYAPDGEPYALRAAVHGRDLHLDVVDHGPGIARRDQRLVFRPFERAQDRLSEATEGTGIGLSLVQHVARGHGGRVTLDSAPGRGATFTLVLPLTDKP